jgi:hypothetical protein
MQKSPLIADPDAFAVCFRAGFPRFLRGEVQSESVAIQIPQ